MGKFMELLDDYLDLRDELKDEENNYNSIPDRIAARSRLSFLRDYIDVWIESIDVRLDILEEEEQ